MRTETVTRTIYKFDELPENVQQKIIEGWRTDDYFHWGDEWRNSLEAFDRNFPVKVRDWEVNPFGNSYVQWSLTCADSEAELEGVRLWKWLMNSGYDRLGTKEVPVAERKPKYSRHLRKAVVQTIRPVTIKEWQDCPLTGYCGDHDILAPIAEFMLRPSDRGPGWERTTIWDLMNDCLEGWRDGFEKDIEHWHSEEAIREDIEGGEYEFYEDGSIA